MKLGIYLYRVAIFGPWDESWLWIHQDTFHNSAKTAMLNKHQDQIYLPMDPNLRMPFTSARTRATKKMKQENKNRKENEERPTRFHFTTNYCISYRRRSFYRRIEGNLLEMSMLYPDPYR